jgi:hypothetical protein
VLGARSLEVRESQRGLLTCLFVQFRAFIGAVPETLNGHSKERVLSYLIYLHKGKRALIQGDVDKWLDGVFR